RLAREPFQSGVDQDSRGEQGRSVFRAEVLRGDTRHNRCTPAAYARPGDLYAADGRGRPVARASAALPYGVPAELRRGAAERVLPAPRAGAGRAAGDRRHSRRRGAALADVGGADDRGGQPVDEPVLPTRLRSAPLYLAIRLGGREAATAAHRGAAGAVRRATPLGQVVYDTGADAASALRACARLPRAASVLRS